MIRRELAKDPKLATESWDRFLPQFRKRHLKTSEKTAKKNDKIAQKVDARNAAGIETTAEDLMKKEVTKKVYTPFPPAQLPRKVDLQLESGEYFLKQSDKEARETQKRKQKVRRVSWLLPLQILILERVFSKQRLQRRSRPSAQRLSSHLRKQPSQPLRRRDGIKSAAYWRRKWITRKRRALRKRKRGSRRKKRRNQTIHDILIISSHYVSGPLLYFPVLHT